MDDAKRALEHLAESPADPLWGDFDISPNVIATLGLLAENARTELEGMTLRYNFPIVY